MYFFINFFLFFCTHVARVQQKMEEVSSLTEKHRLEHERSFHLVSHVINKIYLIGAGAGAVVQCPD